MTAQARWNYIFTMFIWKIWKIWLKLSLRYLCFWLHNLLRLVWETQMFVAIIISRDTVRCYLCLLGNLCVCVFVCVCVMAKCCPGDTYCSGFSTEAVLSSLLFVYMPVCGQILSAWYKSTRSRHGYLSVSFACRLPITDTLGWLNTKLKWSAFYMFIFENLEMRHHIELCLRNALLHL